MTPNTALSVKEREREYLNALLASYFKNGGKVKQCKKQRYHSESKKGQAIIGPGTVGRAGLYIYGG